MKKILLSLTITILTISFNGCSSKTYTISKEYKNAMKKSKNIALIIDSCISYDNIGDKDDYLSIYRSKESVELLGSVVKEKLGKEGFDINYVENRTACAFYKNPSTNVKAKIKEKDAIKKVDLPYFYTEIKDEKYKKALHKVLYKAFISAMKKNKSQEIFFKEKEIYKDLQILKEKTKQDKLLILINKGLLVDASKSIGFSILDRVILKRVDVHNMDYINSYAILVDLIDKKVLWTSGMRLKKVMFSNFDKSWYEGRYYNSVLKPLIDNLK